MVSDDQVFDNMADSEPEVDYTGLNAAHYIDKYTNRPEDQGDLQAIQSMLSTAGIVAPPADMINAAIYSVQGEWGMAALSAGAVIPILGDMHKIKKSGEKMVTLYRAVDKWYNGNMVKNGKYIGGVGDGKNLVIGSQPPGTLWVTEIPIAAKNHLGAGGKGPLLKFEVPESYIKDFGTYNPMSGASPAKVARQEIKSEMLQPGVKYPVVAFKDGLPKEFLTKVYKSWGDFKTSTKPISPLQEKLNKLRDNPNIGGKLSEIMNENVKRYNR